MVTRHIEDLNLGDWITVLRWNDSGALVCPGCDTVLATPRTQWVGKPLKIVAVDMPFVVVEYDLGPASHGSARPPAVQNTEVL